MDNKVKDFIITTTESLEELERSLIVLENDPSRTHLVKEIFSKAHTIKGTCGFLELERLENIFHHLESLLEKMRDEPSGISSSATVMLDGVHHARDILKGLEAEGSEPEGDDTELLARLEEAYSREADQVERQESDQTQPQVVDNDSSLKDRSLKIDVETLDKIINMVGELVLTRNEFLERIQDDWDSPYLSAIQKLDFVTSNLQNESLKTRMQSISNIWDKLPSIIRDGCKKQNKKITLKTSGQETEVDRQVLQAIHDPFIHIIRNAIDHGIELPDERVEAQKPAEGTISLKAYHEGGHIILEVEDDGAGIDFERVKQKAIDKNLISAQDAQEATDRELVKFLFESGFSTSEEVSNISGRGIGMNIVMTEIEKIGGSVDVYSQPGKGTTIRVKIPLTLAILSALTFSADGQSFAIPQTSVSELVRIDEHNRELLGHVQNTKILRLRDTYLPLVNLTSVLNMTKKYYYESKEDFFILVAHVGETRFGIMVDDVQNTQEIAVKPCGSIVEKIGYYSGATILGDGRVILIIDPAGILDKVQLAGMSKLLEKMDHEQEDTQEQTQEEVIEQEKTHFLVFRGSDQHPQTVQLSLIARLEEIEREQIQERGEGYMLKYRDSVLPLVPYDDATLNGNPIQPIIVFSDGKRQMGLMVKAIDDVVEGVLNITSVGGKRDGVLGVSMINDQAMEVIDMNYYLKQAYPDWFDLERSDIQQNRETKILLVDSSQFFRELVKPTLETVGFIVRNAKDGEEALKLIQSNFKPDLIISDIVMPNLDGLGLAEKIRKSSALRDIKLIALTSLMGDEDRDKAMEAGFDKYLVKYNQEELLGAINELIRDEVKQ